MAVGLPLRATPLFLFLHVPKTAGTSAKQAWRNMFRDFYFQFDPAVHRVRPGETAVWQEPGFFDRYLMVGGHAGVSQGLVRRARSTRRRIVFISTFRDAPARVASHYDFIRKRPQHPLYKEIADRTLLQSIEHEGAFRRASVNAQLIQVFGSDQKDAIEAALAQDSYVIGRQDEMDAFLDAVSAVTGLPKPPRLVRANVAEEPGPVSAVPAKEQADYRLALELLAELNKAETEFLTSRVRPVLVTTSVTPWRPKPNAT